jgi:hypothetical protein
MKDFCHRTAEAANTYVVCLDVADSVASITTRMDDQVAAYTQAVQGDKKLKDGFYGVGFSQGTIVLRGYAERRGEADPAVKRMVSLTGTQNGVMNCPTGWGWGCTILKMFSNPYKSWLVFSDYWKDPTDEAK